MRVLAILLAASLGAAVAHAETYPSKPIQWVVPFAPGGTTDVIARSIADRLGAELGQPVVIENKAGGGGSAGTQLVARARPDGYTIGMATVSTHAVNPACNAKVGYHPIKDFLPVTNVARTPNVLLVNKNFPPRNMKELVAEVKRNPGKYQYATSGHCGVAHMMGELFQMGTGTSMVHVPYAGGGPALQDVVDGRVPIMFDNLPSSMARIRSGDVRALAIASEQRIPALPDVPTFRESELRTLNDSAWYGVVVPAGTPQSVITRLHGAFTRVLAVPEVRAKLKEAGAEAIGNSPADFWVDLNAELGKMTMVTRQQKIAFKE